MRIVILSVLLAVVVSGGCPGTTSVPIDGQASLQTANPGGTSAEQVHKRLPAGHYAGLLRCITIAGQQSAGCGEDGRQLEVSLGEVEQTTQVAVNGQPHQAGDVVACRWPGMTGTRTYEVLQAAYEGETLVIECATTHVEDGGATYAGTARILLRYDPVQTCLVYTNVADEFRTDLAPAGHRQTRYSAVLTRTD